MQYYSFIFITHLLSSTTAEESTEVIHEPNYKDYEYMKETSYDDSEPVYNKTSKVCSVRSFMFTYTKGVLHISFTPAFIEKNYIVFLETDTLTLRLNNVKAEPMVNLTYGRHDFSEDKEMHVRIVCFCESQDFTSRPFRLKAYKTAALDCRFWNVNASLYAFPSNYSVNVVFLPYPNYQECFRNYTVELFICNETCQLRDASFKKVKEAIYNNSVVTVTFGELSSSYYSAMITAKHQHCLDNICGQTRTESIQLSEPNIPKPVPLESEQVGSIPVIIALSIMAVVVIIGVIGARKLKNCPIYQQHDIKSSDGQDISENSGNASEKKETIIVSILHAQSIELEREVVLAIYDFLKDCCDVHPVTAEKNPKIFVKPTGWIQKNFNYTELLSERVIHKVLIVETDAAGKLHEHWSNQREDRPMPAYRNYSHLDWIFPRGLTELFTSPEFFGTDHNRVLLVSFRYCKNPLSCFTQKRIYLPYQTVELYNSLWNEKKLLKNEEKLKNKWRENEAYKKLLKKIEEMEMYVRANENYLDSCVFDTADDAVLEITKCSTSI